MKKKTKVSLFDWRFKIGIFLLVLGFLVLAVGLVLIPTASFINRFDSKLGDGFWVLNNYHFKDLLFNWTCLDDQAIGWEWLSHPFLQIFIALLFIAIIFPLFFLLGCSLILRWWVKTRI